MDGLLGGRLSLFLFRYKGAEPLNLLHFYVLLTMTSPFRFYFLIACSLLSACSQPDYSSPQYSYIGDFGGPLSHSRDSNNEVYVDRLSVRKQAAGYSLNCTMVAKNLEEE